jgi:transcriptional regulator with XRE-family HTH domain
MVQTIGHEPNPARRLRLRQGARLREVRTSLRGLTLQELAARMNAQEGVTITPQAISMWERGDTSPRPHLQVAVAKALDVLPSSIFGLDAEAA